LNRINEKIKQIKQAGIRDILKLSFNDKIVSLRMVDDSEETINLLLEWRNEYWDGFNTKFKGTYERTKKWLINQVLKNPDRVLFLIILDGKKIGHIGIFYNKKEDSFWFENIIKGVKDSAPGIMEFVEKRFIKWVFDEFNVSQIKGYIFSDNYKTIRMHEKCGFLTLDAIPLKRKFTTDGWIWEKIKLSSQEEYGERYFLMMVREKGEKNI